MPRFLRPLSGRSVAPITKGSKGERWIMDRFIARTRKTASGCLEWVGYLGNSGYGRFKVNGKLLWAHRVAYTLFVGEIPDGMTIDHLCRNRKCVNPVHLEVVTPRINTLRGEAPTAKNAMKTHCHAGHLLDAENTYRYHGTRACKKCRESARERHRAKVAV